MWHNDWSPLPEKAYLKLPDIFVIHSRDIRNPEATVCYDNGNYENIRICTSEGMIFVFSTLIFL